MPEQLKSNTKNHQLASDPNSAIDLHQDALDTRVITLERLVADLINLIESNNNNGLNNNNKLSISSREISRELENISQAQTLAAATNQQITHRIEKIEQKTYEEVPRELENISQAQTLAAATHQQITHRIEKIEKNAYKIEECVDDLVTLKTQVKDIEVRLDKFYDTLNFLNRYQHQLDGIIHRVDTLEKSLGSLEASVSATIASKIDMLFSESQQLRSLLADTNYAIETRMSSVEHTLLNFVSPRRFISAVKRKILRKLGKSV